MSDREVILIHVPLRPPTLNDWHGRPSWVYARIRNTWFRWIRPAVRLAHRQNEPRRVVEVTRHMGPRERQYDQENAFGGLKPIIDCLRIRRWLRNDGPKDCHRVLRPDVRDGCGPATTIVIREERP